MRVASGGEPSFLIWALAFGFSSYSLCTLRAESYDGQTKATLTAQFPTGGA